jgi:hypothetical protein
MNKKDIIYVDQEDEIASIIEKVKSCQNKIVALVPPKKSQTLKSSVNMKLIKKTTDKQKKKLVLVTNDQALVRLASLAGLYVASDLHSKPYMPTSEEDESDELEIRDIGASPVVKTEPRPEAVAKSAKLADNPKAVVEKTGKFEIEPTLAAVSLSSQAGDSSSAEMWDASSMETINRAVQADDVKPDKVDKSLKVPNFGSFRKKFMLLGFVGLLLMSASFVFFKAERTAVVDLTTETSSIDIETKLNLLPGGKDNIETGAIAATKVAKTASFTAALTATGTKDLGAKASGSVTLINCTLADVTIPVGTAYSAGDKNYLSIAAVTVPASSFKYGACTNDGTANVNVSSQEKGDNYNSVARAYQVAGAPSGITANGSAMSGGSSRIAKIITQKDIDDAAAKIEKFDGTKAIAEINKGVIPENMLMLTTVVVSEPKSAATPAVGEESATGSGTLKYDYTYSGLVVARASIKSLISFLASKKIDVNQQTLIDDGSLAAKYEVRTKNSDGSYEIIMTTNGKAGPKLDVEKLKTEFAGKPSGDIQQALRTRTGVKSVDVKFKPFWATRAPKDVSKITVNIRDAVVQ